VVQGVGLLDMVIRSWYQNWKCDITRFGKTRTRVITALKIRDFRNSTKVNGK
jgi:hypothetical protein